tara:strand:- start:150 stop:1229 length:1080 start_codon:yes stop_codon:yes gene_type:complete
MISKYKIFHKKFLYIFFVFLSLNIFFFSTNKVEGKAFEINNIEISKPFEINFNKNKVIDEGFREAFSELISLIVNSSDRKKISSTKLNEIKGMVETFSIKEEKFIDETYFVNLGVSFNKKKVFNYLEKKNIFPSIPIKKKLLFVPIIIDENKKELLLFSNNEIFNKWNDLSQTFHLLDYILPTADLEDINLIKNKYENIEQYDFMEITNKYNLKDSIIALFYKDKKEIRVLSRITISDNIILKNQTFLNIDFDNIGNVENIINDLKIIYEDYWKNFNQINTSIRLTLNIKVENLDNLKISNFEKVLNQIDLIYDFYITKFDKSYTYYQVVFNGTPNNFLKTMSYNDYKFNTQNKIWVLE